MLYYNSITVEVAFTVLHIYIVLSSLICNDVP